jgi:hypothetical protein
MGISLVDYEDLLNKLRGKTVLKPHSGTLSGHAAGEPFDKHVYRLVKEQLPNQTFRQFEYLNDIFRKNPNVIGFEARKALFDSPTVMFLLSRGKSATEHWSEQQPFDEKQNDTADILVVKDGFYEIIDVKTRNMAKNAQAPNIISAYKLAQTCALMLENQEFSTFSINYVEIDWKLQGDDLCCTDAHARRLFSAHPSQLYINWAAAMQIQFHVTDLDQDFDSSLEVWAREYLRHFTTQARRRAKDMITKFVKPFEKYL